MADSSSVPMRFAVAMTLRISGVSAVSTPLSAVNSMSVSLSASRRSTRPSACCRLDEDRSTPAASPSSCCSVVSQHCRLPAAAAAIASISLPTVVNAACARTTTPLTLSAACVASVACLVAWPLSPIRPSICAPNACTMLPMRTVAARVSSARLLTSPATTAKPRPASPARAASIPALRDNSRVCLAMVSIAADTLAICFSTGPKEANRSSMRATEAVSWEMFCTAPPISVRDSEISAPAALAAPCALREA